MPWRFQLLCRSETPIKPSDGSSAPTGSAAPTGASPTDIPAKSTAAAEDQQITIRLLFNKDVVKLSLHDYLIGVVSAEMPASFQPEALKAQAVAARTYVLYKMLVSPAQNHPQADVCNDITCCNAYIDQASMQKNWGADYEKNLQKITAAVESTDGVTMLYENKPILAVFHSSSNGHTEASEAVWGGALPYLVSVASPETAQQVPNYISTVTVSTADFEKTIQSSDKKAAFGKDRSKWVTDLVRTDSGRLKTVSIGGVSFSGPVLRTLFDLRSAAIDIKVTDTGVTFTTTGYGHGVGMSQYGANSLAAQGSTYSDILKWYYTGITLASEKDLF